MEQLEEIRKIWHSNRELWLTKVGPEILQPIQKNGGLKFLNEWEKIVGVAFENSLGTFEAVQRLCDPNESTRFWAEGLILTRTNFETFVTLAWIHSEDHEARLALFIDEGILRKAYFLDQVEELRDSASKEQLQQISEAKEEVKKRRPGIGPNRQSLMPSLEKRAYDLAKEQAKKFSDARWQYDVYYRDVSSHAHPSTWGLSQSVSFEDDDFLIVEPQTWTGFKAVWCNGGWLFKMLYQWNAVFNHLPVETLDEWFKEWITTAGY